MGNANKKWKEKGGDGIGGAEGLLNLTFDDVCCKNYEIEKIERDKRFV
jgi:hypothetical protein